MIRARVTNSDTTPADDAGDHDRRSLRPAAPGQQDVAGDDAVVERRARRSPIVCVVSWPLPAMTTTSPGSAPRDAPARSPPAGRARPRRGRGRRRRRRRGSSSMIAGGSSRARVVGCDDHAVGEPRRRRRPSRGRFARSRSPPEPNTTITRPPAPTTAPAAAITSLEPVGRVGVVDDHVDRRRRRRRRGPLEAPGHGLGGSQAGDDGVDGRCRAPPRSSPRRARSSTLNAPPSGDRRRARRAT